MSDFREVLYSEFLAFLDAYPRKLTADCSGISEPPLMTYSDFSVGAWPEAIVAKYHRYEDPNKRIYQIKEHADD